MAANGNRGRFSDRIKKIAFRKRNRMIYKEDENNKVQYQNVLKVLAAIPGMVYSNVHIDDSKKSEISPDNNRKFKQLSLINDIDVGKIRKKQDIYFNGRKILVNADIDTKNDDGVKKDINVKTSIKRDQSVNSWDNTDNLTLNIVDSRKYKDNYASINVVDNEQVKKHDEKVEKLEKDILDIIKKKLVLSINKLEILQSELYILSEVNGNAKTQEECERQIKEIKELLNKIEKLKEQYDFLKDNYDFEYLMSLDDDNLIDKIIELKDIFDKNEIRAFVEDYKLLEEYKYLYLKIDKLQEETNGLEEDKDKELEKLKERDINFEKLKNKIYNADGINDMYKNMIKEQNEILKDMEKNASKINSYEQVNYHIKGLNKLLFNSFKYFGLLMLSPLKGVFPAIAMQTLMTRDMIRGMYHGIQWEETRKMVYEASDYSSSISQLIDNMDYISNSIDDNLDKLIKLKEIYNRRFKKYQDDNREYKEVIDRINDMENKLLGNKIKVEIMKKKALEQKKVNNKKLILVNKLNDEQNK